MYSSKLTARRASKALRTYGCDNSVVSALVTEFVEASLRNGSVNSLLLCQRLGEKESQKVCVAQVLIEPTRPKLAQV